VNWEFHDAAQAELTESAAWYERRRVGLGEQFIRAVFDAIQLIRSNPLTWRKIHGDVRWLRVRRFPFAVIYRVRESTIQIIAVMHYSRKPGYWTGRLTI
jgi:plasmid stabilization system protein ParE